MLTQRERLASNEFSGSVHIILREILFKWTTQLEERQTLICFMCEFGNEKQSTNTHSAVCVARHFLSVDVVGQKLNEASFNGLVMNSSVYV